MSNINIPTLLAKFNWLNRYKLPWFSLLKIGYFALSTILQLLRRIVNLPGLSHLTFTAISHFLGLLDKRVGTWPKKNWLYEATCNILFIHHPYMMCSHEFIAIIRLVFLNINFDLRFSISLIIFAFNLLNLLLLILWWLICNHVLSSRRLVSFILFLSILLNLNLYVIRVSCGSLIFQRLNRLLLIWLPLSHSFFWLSISWLIR